MTAQRQDLIEGPSAGGYTRLLTPVMAFFNAVPLTRDLLPDGGLSLAIDAHGSVYIAGTSGDVFRFHDKTESVARWATLPGPVMGMAFDSRGAMWATVAGVGLVTVSPSTRSVRRVVSSYNNHPLLLPIGLAIDLKDNVFFTEALGSAQPLHDRELLSQDRAPPHVQQLAQQVEQLRNSSDVLYELLYRQLYSGARSGRLLYYDADKRHTIELGRNLAFPAGVALAERCVLVCEAAAARLVEFCAERPPAPVLQALPMLPYSIHASRSNVGYWIGSIGTRNRRQAAVLQSDWLRNLVLAIPALQPDTSLPPASSIFHLGENRTVSGLFQSNEQVRGITAAAEYDNKLFLSALGNRHMLFFPLR